MQQVTTLVPIGPRKRSSRPAMELFFLAARRLQQIPGFRRLQGFRALDASDSLLLLLDWEPTGEDCAMDLAVCALVRRAETLGLDVGPMEFLETTFDRCLLREGAVATLVRLSRTDGVRAGASPLDVLDRDDEFSLRGLAAPGTTRLYGARSEDGDAAVCRIDFDSEDGIWHFLDSPLRQAWSLQPALLSETWALNLPRLEVAAPEAEADEPEDDVPESEGSLSVRLSRSLDGHTAHIRLQGNVDARNSALTERFCVALLDEGCTELRVDVSDLEGISPDALLMLARTARGLKAVGGKFTLVDNAVRVRRITRAKHLESVLI